MEKVWVVYHHYHERNVGWRGWISNLVGLNDTRCTSYVWKIFDTEDKAKNFIRELVAMDHELNNVRRDKGLDAHDYELNEEDLVEFGDVDSYWHVEKGIRTTVYYSYRHYNVR